MSGGRQLDEVAGITTVPERIQQQQQLWPQKHPGYDSINSSSPAESARLRGQSFVPAMADFLEKEDEYANKWYVRVMLGSSLLFTIGVLCFMIMNEWTFINAFYFCVVTVTTVGFGDLVPTTAPGKLFTMFFAVASIMMLSYALGEFSGSMLDRVEQLLDPAKDDPQVDELAMVMKQEDRRLTNAVCTVLIALLVGAVIFIQIEGMIPLNAFYLSVVGATTIGFGDMYPQSDLGKIITSLWLLFSVAAMTRLVTIWTERSLIYKYSRIRNHVLSLRLTADADHFASVDRDKDGKVKRAEYFYWAAMKILQSGKSKITLNDAQQIVERFKQMDKDNDGDVEQDEYAKKAPAELTAQV